MVEKEKLRLEIDNKDKWDLELMYDSENIWEKDYKSIENKVKEFVQYKEKLLDTPNNLLSAISLYLDIDRVLNNLTVYAYMRSDEDTSNTHYQSLKGRIVNLATETSKVMSFFIPELLKGDYNKILEYINQEVKLRDYQFFLEDIYRFKKYVLTEKEEKIISSMSKIIDKSNETASLLRDSDLKFGNIVDKNNEKVTITNSNYSIYIKSNDRNVRKQAFETMYEAYSGMKNTFASTLSGVVDANIELAKLRGYSDPLFMSLYQNNINANIYNNLIKVVNKNLNIVYKYYDLKKEILELDKLHLYDVYVELIEKSDKEFSFEEAKQLIIKALGVLGEDYINDLKKSFDEKWIDIYPNKAKRSGAYSWGSYDSRPYILLNYHNRFDDVSTLAHELGHSMHSYYSRKNNHYQYADYAIFVAEVASTVNELLLCKYILNTSNDKTIKLTILNKMMELFRTTIYRQTMFAEFEKNIYDKAMNGEILTNQLLSDLYYDLNKKYFGNNVNINEEIRYEWSRIPHFYSNFYVYQYATGLSAACHIVNNILNNKKESLENYLEFLKTGGRDYPVELLKIAGVDMNDPEVIESAIEMFNETIDEFINLYNN